ncbi:hypothetical protein TNCV_3993291 [Trichonephila clavipes]|uniref:Uncharacterized protein n=1 Tax=Trichonephila clavipes TaxID=2585209 RepID=A0A8X6T1J2_TRICX|nr:hypothetical protein TNCV_3993291 [Trichonephila clavipes]
MNSWLACRDFKPKTVQDPSMLRGPLHIKSVQAQYPLCWCGDDQGDTPEILDEISTTARDLELEVNEDDIEELIMGHADELTIELQEI